uniref:Unconventional myosin-6 n=1 Tax=Macrostomum lignano TaxID=282301 RepID=A0A1I8GZ60_9PLAT
MDGKKVWAPHPKEGYKLGKITDLGSENVVVETLSSPKEVLTVPYNRLFPSEEYDNKDVEDNCALMYLNEATLLNNIRLRYMKNAIYTYVANILIAVNPYFEVPKLYAKDTIKAYQGKSLGTMPPHVFAIGDKAYRDMKAFKASQAIIVSGESGSGKTETAKHIFKYLTENYGAHAGPIEQRIVESNPLLEGFGNAKTVRNNNSSRFGKFVEIHFDNRSLVTGGYISHYLLEKSRICVQSEGERNYHIFYRLCAGADAALRQKLGLVAPDQFRYLQIGALKDIQLDDVKDFRNVDKAMTDMGLADSEKQDIYSVVAGVLHLGNVNFEESGQAQGVVSVTPASRPSLDKAAQLLGVDPARLEESLITRITQAARGGAQGGIVRIALRLDEAASARDALAKAVYSRLFDYIVLRVNQALPFSGSQSYIGVLDIAGFEYFQRNSYEQFSINYCNEKLQQFFNERVLKEEQQLYQKEGLNDCIDLIEAKGSGIFYLLDEQSKLPKPSPETFTLEVYAKNKNHFRLAYPRKSKLKSHRELRDDEGFLIRHFAGAVCYHTDQFIEKNNDALHASLEAIVKQSSSGLVRSLFDDAAGGVGATVAADGSVRKAGGGGSKIGTGKLAFISVGSKFKAQLAQLMDKLRSTGTCFIRCIKPNVRMVDHLFEGADILSQLQCSGMASVLDLMQQGYPSRTKFDELYQLYKGRLPPQLSRLDPRLFCKLLFHALGLNENDFKFGISKVFFRPGKFAEFDQLLRSDPENIAALVAKVKSWLVRYRWRKAQYCTWEVVKLRRKIAWRREMLVKVQKTMRMWICVKKYRPRIRGLAKVQSLRNRLSSMNDIVGQLKADKDAAKKSVDTLIAEVDGVVKQIKSAQRMSYAEIDAIYSKLSAKFDASFAELKKRLEQQKVREEQERLRRIQEEMERERAKKADEERQRQQAEEEKRAKAELEERRRREEAERKKQEEADRKAAAVLQKQMEEEAEANRKQSQDQEQERLDRELALRLASEDANQVEDLQGAGGGLTRGANVLQKRAQMGNSKYDLSKWKYAELRDTINTSCDLELLAACREEFQRRLKVYHEWKQKNKQRGAASGAAGAGGAGGKSEGSRAPQSVLENAVTVEGAVAAQRQLAGRIGEPGDPKSQRYFRIPFARPNELNRGTEADQHSGGLWWAHFDGRWIARQMEVQPGQPAVLLVAGVDDMSMCELGLEETGLPQKKGAEVTATEFDREWEKHGGAAVLKQHRAAVSSLFLKKNMK